MQLKCIISKAMCSAQNAVLQIYRSQIILMAEMRSINKNYWPMVYPDIETDCLRTLPGLG